MNKNLNKVVIALGASMLLAACGPASSSQVVADKVFVTFFSDTIGTIYDEVEIDKGTAVARPTANPTKTGYTFVDWYSNLALTTTYNFTSLVNADLDIYAKFSKDYVADLTDWHLIGDFKNPNYPATWSLTNANNMSLVPASGSNLFSFTLDMGYNAAFKVKELAPGWGDSGYTVYGYDDIRASDLTTLGADVVKAGLGDIVIKNAGNYKVELESDLEELRLTRLGNTTVAGVAQNPDPNSVLKVGIVGTLTGWANNADINLTLVEENNGDYYEALVVDLAVDSAFKLRENGSWTVNYGFSDLFKDGDNNYTFPAGAFVNGTGNDEGNIITKQAGLYSIWFQKVGNVGTIKIFEVEFYVAGDITGTPTGDGNNWFNEFELVQDATNQLVFKVEDLALGANDLFKIKLGNSWNMAFGFAELATNSAFVDAGGNFKVVTAGTYDITLTLTLSSNKITATGAVVITPSAA
jgi:uncharacterized repeat protein (TIGR02543 family)